MSTILSKPVPEVGFVLSHTGKKVNLLFEVDYRYINFLPDTFQKIEHDNYSTIFAEATLKVKNNFDLVGIHYGLDDMYYFYHNYSETNDVTNIKLLKAQFVKLSVARSGFLNQSEFEVAALHFFLNEKDKNIELQENYGLQLSLYLKLKSKTKKAIRMQYQIRRELYLFEDNLVHRLRIGFLI